MTIAQHLGQLNRKADINQRAKDFAHVARWLTLAAANRTDAVDLAERDRAPPQIVQAVKAAVDAGSTTGWGQPLAGYETLAEGFLQSLRQASAFDAMLPSMRSLVAVDSAANEEKECVSKTKCERHRGKVEKMFVVIALLTGGGLSKC